MEIRCPRRKPSRMPCLTQALTRQPVGCDASGSAERRVPASRASRSCRKALRASGFPMAAGPWANQCSMEAWRSFCMDKTRIQRPDGWGFVSLVAEKHGLKEKCYGAGLVVEESGAGGEVV